MRITRRASPYLFLIHLIPCSWGSTMRGQRWQEVRMVAFSVDILSAGSPSFCHTAMSASSVSIVRGSKSGVTGMGTLQVINSMNEVCIIFTTVVVVIGLWFKVLFSVRLLHQAKLDWSIDHALTHANYIPCGCCVHSLFTLWFYTTMAISKVIVYFLYRCIFVLFVVFTLSNLYWYQKLVGKLQTA